MKRERDTKTAAAAVCCALAGLLLLFVLQTEIRLSAVNDEIGAVRREKETLEENRSVLNVRLAERWNLTAIESYATEVLGMQRCRPGQIVEIEITP